MATERVVVVMAVVVAERVRVEEGQARVVVVKVEAELGVASAEVASVVVVTAVVVWEAVVRELAAVAMAREADRWVAAKEAMAVPMVVAARGNTYCTQHS